MFKVIKYEKSFESDWNEFVNKSKNGVFFFNRNYMDYHSHRFIDHSLLFYDNNKLIALLPLSLHEDVVISHGGLTFGSFITNDKMTTPLMLEMFEMLKAILTSKGIRKIRYKAIPNIYHSTPSDEDLYALFINNAPLVRRDVSTTILLSQKINYAKGRKHSINKAKKAGLKVLQTNDYATFMTIEEEVLTNKYNVKPVHSIEEITLLANRFPENIKLFAAFKDNKMLAGTIIYESKNVAHAQYLANNEEGKNIGALDIVIDYLLNDYYKDIKYFDFGISTEKDGRYLNQGLISQKEMFGGRATVYDTYELYL